MVMHSRSIKVFRGWKVSVYFRGDVGLFIVDMCFMDEFFMFFNFVLFPFVRVNNDGGSPFNILWGLKIKFKICKLILKYWSFLCMWEHSIDPNWEWTHRLEWTGLDGTRLAGTEVYLDMSQKSCNRICFINVDWVAAYINSCENGEYFIYSLTVMNINWASILCQIQPSWQALWVPCIRCEWAFMSIIPPNVIMQFNLDFIEKSFNGKRKQTENEISWITKGNDSK